MMSFQTVIFDLDGVIIDSIPVMRQAFTIAYAEVVGPGPPPFDTYRTHFGLGFDEIMRKMGLPATMRGPFIRESNARVSEIRVYEGVRPMLSNLRRSGLKLGIATGKDGARARHILDVLSLRREFDAVLGSDEVERPKPAPDMVLRQLERFEVPPGAALMVGDAVADLRCGRNAGVRTAAALWGDGTPSVLLPEKPDFVLRSPVELLALVGSAHEHA